MFLLGHKKKRFKSPISTEVQNADIESTLVSSLKNDVLGSDEWKRSKIGFLTGYSAAIKAARSIVNSASETSSRVRFLWSTLTYSPQSNVPQLDDPSLFKDGKERFSTAMAVQHVTEAKLNVIQKNTFRSFYLYSLLFVTYLFMIALSIALWPPAYSVEYLSRLGAAPIIGALLIKAAYTNWIIRNRSADTFLEYVKSKSWLPVK